MRKLVGALDWIRHTTPLQEGLLLAAILLLAVMARLTFGIFLHPLGAPPIYDEEFYDYSASQIIAGEGYRSIFGLTAAKPPVYPYFLAGVYCLFGESNTRAIRLVQIFLDTSTCILIYLIGKSLGGKILGAISGVGAALYPLSIYMSSELYPETVFLFLECLMLLVTLQMIRSNRSWPALAGGVLFGLCSLARPNVSLLLGFILIYPFLLDRKPAVKRVFLYSLGVFLAMVPWSVRNYQIFGAFVPLTTEGGAVFWSDNHPMAEGGTVIPNKQTWPGEDDPDLLWAGWSELTEPESSQRFMQAGWEWVKTHPGDFLSLIPKKIARLWSPAAFTTQSNRYASSKRQLLWIPYVPFLATVIAGVMFTVKRWRKWWIIYGLILATNLSTAIFAGGTRYSIPMLPALMLLSSMGAIFLLSKAFPESMAGVLEVFGA